ncbi:MAG: hypothetical protein F6J95_003860 [Leptolyngbya sp. SIO1E4]|nr:hypothetical protein [Leptolyngbya sp. SIO1E4]
MAKLFMNDLNHAGADQGVMSYPSFTTYIKTLESLLKRKGEWLLRESRDLAELCLSYSKALGLTPQGRKSLVMAAYFKNLGAIYLSDYLLEQEFLDHGEMMASLNIWFAESTQLARNAGLPEVAVILEQYHLRKVPEHKLARVFQVLNTWVACQQSKAWGQSMTDREARIVLEQRACLNWSDPNIVRHFVQHYSRRRVQARKLKSTYA